MLDAIGGVIDKADSLLGGSPPGAGTTGKPVFRRAGPLPSDPDNGDSLQLGLNAGGTDPNSASIWPPIEFIHYGRVHTDKWKPFRHITMADASDKEKLKGRAIVFRNALEREAVLLQGFITSCKAVLQEYQSNRGLIGEVGQAVGKLFGSGASEPDPAELDTFKKNTAKAGGLVNKKEIKYLDVHKTGIDLHQTRADFNEFAKKLGDHYLKPSSDPISGAGAALTSLPGVGNAAALVQGIIFKVFDIYLGMFLKVREQYEDDIEEASYQMTLQAIRNKQVPTYAVWFANAAPAAPPPPPPGNAVDRLLKPVTDAIDDARSEVQDFFGTGANGPATPGDAQLDAAFAPMQDAPKQIIDAFQTVLGVGELPSFVVDVLTELCQCNLAMLKGVYTQILKQSASQPVNDQVLLAAGRKYLTRKIIDLLISLTSLNFLQSDNDLASVQGMGVSGKQLSNKAASLLDEQVGQYAEFILKFAVGQLADRLNEAHDLARRQEGVTMEVYLGRLPWLLALMMRNTFFPMWDLIVDKVFGTIAGPLGQVASPVKSMLGEAKDVASTAKDVKNRVTQAKDQLAKGVDQDNVDNFVNNLVNGPAGPTAPPPDDPSTLWPWDWTEGQAPNVTPKVSTRLKPGEGLQVTAADIEAGEAQTAQLVFA